MTAGGESSGTKAIERLLFAATFLSYAYFHNGGGWNQNARFAQIRALVEQRTFAIDSYFIYRRDPRPEAPASHLYRVPVEHGAIAIDGARYSLAWMESGSQPVRLEPSSDLPPVALDSLGASGDVTFAAGHVLPNKGPGVTLLAAPAYFVIHSFEQLLGLDADDWWTLTVNAWLTSVFSVGLVSAFCCVAFFRVAVAIADARAAVIATGAFAWGTLFFPYATMLYEHDPMAAAFLASFWLLFEESREAAREVRHGADRVFWAGTAAGAGVMCNYVGLPVAGFLGLYSAYRLGRRRAAAFVAGLVPVLVALGLYDLACFGAPWRISYTSQNPLFVGAPWIRRIGSQAPAVADLLLGVIGPPRAHVLFAILVSPFRGLFYSSPVLLIGVVGLAMLFRRDGFRPEAWLFTAIVVFFVAFNVCFNGWEGGWATGPRYLIPAMPFAAIGIAIAVRHTLRTTVVLLAISVAAMFVATAVDPQAPIVPAETWWRYDPIIDYQLALFLGGSPNLVWGETEGRIARYEHTLEVAGVPAPVRAQRIDQARNQLRAAADRGDERFFPISTRRGPVSVNPTGIYEASFYQVFSADSVPATWNSFNLGELLFPGSRWSLLPLLSIGGFLASIALRRTQRWTRRAG